MICKDVSFLNVIVEDAKLSPAVAQLRRVMAVMLVGQYTTQSASLFIIYFSGGVDGVEAFSES